MYGHVDPTLELMSAAGTMDCVNTTRVIDLDEVLAEFIGRICRQTRERSLLPKACKKIQVAVVFQRLAKAALAMSKGKYWRHCRRGRAWSASRPVSGSSLGSGSRRVDRDKIIHALRGKRMDQSMVQGGGRSCIVADGRVEWPKGST